jgi:DNA-binding LacI/PurR family transcriptional regulator
MHMTPGLTSVEQPAEELGITASKILLNILQSDNYPKDKIITLDGKLNVRGSSQFER